jgi:hypothetical protein
VPVRLGKEVQAVLRRGDGELNRAVLPPPAWNLGTSKGSLMKSRQGYKGYVIVARSCELREGEFSAEFSVEEHDADGIMETEFYLPDTFPTQESAIEAAVHAGRQKIDAGFERGSAAVNG